jgi:hypothetical protein
VSEIENQARSKPKNNLLWNQGLKKYLKSASAFFISQANQALIYLFHFFFFGVRVEKGKVICKIFQKFCFITLGGVG